MTTAQLDEVFRVIQVEILFATVHEKVALILSVHEKFYQSRYGSHECNCAGVVKVLLERILSDQGRTSKEVRDRFGGWGLLERSTLQELLCQGEELDVGTIPGARDRAEVRPMCPETEQLTTPSASRGGRVSGPLSGRCSVFLSLKRGKNSYLWILLEFSVSSCLGLK